MHLSPTREVALIAPAGEPDGDRRAGCAVVRSALPAARRPRRREEGASEPPLLADRPRAGGRAAAYVCERFACQAPVGTADELAALLGSGLSRPERSGASLRRSAASRPCPARRGPRASTRGGSGRPLRSRSSMPAGLAGQRLGDREDRRRRRPAGSAGRGGPRRSRRARRSRRRPRPSAARASRLNSRAVTSSRDGQVVGPGFARGAAAARRPISERGRPPSGAALCGARRLIRSARGGRSRRRRG